MDTPQESSHIVKHSNPDENVSSQNTIIETRKRQFKLEDFKVIKYFIKNKVHLVEDKLDHDKLYVLKILDKNYYGDTERDGTIDNSMCQLEDSIYATDKGSDRFRIHLDHPNIVKMYGYFHSENNIYLVLEYIKARDLYIYMMQKDYLQEFEARDIVKSVAHALHYCHTIHNVVHCDIKPENILIDRDHQSYKLVDFDLSFVIREGRPFMVRGTLNYMAPQVLANTTECHYGIDVWSLGVTLYEMVVGYDPFRCDIKGSAFTDFETIHRIENGIFEFPTQPCISKQCTDLIQRMLIVDVDKRITIPEILRHPWLIDV